MPLRLEEAILVSGPIRIISELYASPIIRPVILGSSSIGNLVSTAQKNRSHHSKYLPHFLSDLKSARLDLHSITQISSLGPKAITSTLKPRTGASSSIETQPREEK